MSMTEGVAPTMMAGAAAVPLIADVAFQPAYLGNERPGGRVLNVAKGITPTLQTTKDSIPLVADVSFQPHYLTSARERAGERKDVLSVAEGATGTLQAHGKSIPLVVDRNGTSSTITASWSKGVSLKADYGRFVIDDMRLRNITPEEAERLQGFPTGWTDIPGATKSKRYTALGNSMSLNVLEWIAERIEVVDDLIRLDG